ncbi:hypothetical protein Acr_00g0015150 [Actinidia rufa]|uniref:Retrotransposon Copia-like N-terminal domain-containing protein n=1 Tax=Actinidia rufa TaxID=165716 RepID=A0A7J0DC92_9ERIC|nr:hypothetical protein Acr_00g0015150 [Actinidia rufa]
MTTASGSSCESDSADVSFMGSAWGAKFLSITTIKLNERNYHPWAKSIQVYLLAQGQALFSLSPNYMSLDAFYGKFCCICEEIALSELITYDISAMKRQASPCGLLVSFQLWHPHLMVFAISSELRSSPLSLLQLDLILVVVTVNHHELAVLVAMVVVILVVVATVEGLVRGDVLTATKRIILLIVHGHPAVHQASVSISADLMVSISVEEYQRLLVVESSATTTLA